MAGCVFPSLIPYKNHAMLGWAWPSRPVHRPRRQKRLTDLWLANEHVDIRSNQINRYSSSSASMLGHKSSPIKSHTTEFLASVGASALNAASGTDVANNESQLAGYGRKCCRSASLDVEDVWECGARNDSLHQRLGISIWSASYY